MYFHGICNTLIYSCCLCVLSQASQLLICNFFVIYRPFENITPHYNAELLPNTNVNYSLELGSERSVVKHQIWKQQPDTQGCGVRVEVGRNFRWSPSR
jgi:hypothetical protein